GWAYAGADRTGRPRIAAGASWRGWSRIGEMLGPEIRDYDLSEKRWDTPIASAIARRSAAAWLDAVAADAEVRGTLTGLRGFFLADPEELSLLALVDQFAGDDVSRPGPMYRIAGGNDRLATAIAAKLGPRLHLRTELVAVSQRGPTVRATLKDERGQAQLASDYLVLALPATLIRRIPMTPSFPARQHDAIAALKYGRATKTLLQFSHRFWRASGRP